MNKAYIYFNFFISILAFSFISFEFKFLFFIMLEKINTLIQLYPLHNNMLMLVEIHLK